LTEEPAPEQEPKRRSFTGDAPTKERSFEFRDTCPPHVTGKFRAQQFESLRDATLSERS
jgi:hypothetical protein